eukprot:TRINITY_DN7458_c0_g1_i4.p1 TRINITY_DN7458_c0_g1~~TRINITY_DN7458_c0_g1_i4.p1  ORF type:complete len:217 (-),score=22.52 TRINITY_DN7458_c0_g1_i4:249-899(-)
MDIFVLSGQSNMAGRGGVVNSRWDHNVPPECQPNPSIFRLDADLQWSQANEPLHIDIDTNKACGIGPGMVFANTVLEHYKCRENARIGLVPCAIGGTAIREWERGSLLYNNMISRTNEALKNGVLRAILWYQGESDTLSEDTANSYKENLEKLICDIRSDLKQPNLLFIKNHTPLWIIFLICMQNSENAEVLYLQVAPGISSDNTCPPKSLAGKYL